MSMLLKRVAGVLFVAVLMVALASCGGQQGEQLGTTEPEQTSEPTPTPEPTPAPTPIPIGQFRTIDDWHIRVDSVEFSDTFDTGERVITATGGMVFILVEVSVINNDRVTRQFIGEREDILAGQVSARMQAEMDGIWHRSARITYNDDSMYWVQRISDLFGEPIVHDRTTTGTLLFMVSYDIISSDNELILEVIPNFPNFITLDFDLRQ